MGKTSREKGHINILSAACWYSGFRTARNRTRAQDRFAIVPKDRNGTELLFNDEEIFAHEAETKASLSNTQLAGVGTRTAL